MRISSRETLTRRRWGQNFLIDPGAVDAIIAAFRPADGDRVLEIGPGRGVLTHRLLGRVGALRAVEIDPALAAWLATEIDRAPARAVGRTDVAIVRADVLQVDVASILAGMGADTERPARVIASLPYNIATAVILRLIGIRHLLRDLLLMVQREVAERILSPPGRKSYGGLSVLCQATGRIESVLRLPPEAFRPRPKVESEVIRIIPSDADRLGTGEYDALAALLRMSFAHRRKTLRNNLAASMGHDAAQELIASAGLPGRSRPEAVDVAGYLRLLTRWVARRSGI